MPNINLVQLDKFITTKTALERISSLGNPVCLSGKWGASSEQFNYDILSASPSLILTEQRGKLIISSPNKRPLSVHQDALDWLNSHLKETRVDYTVDSANLNTPALPFVFGFIGYASYDYSKQLERLPNNTIDDMELPDLCGGLYHWNLINDNQNEISYLAFGPYCTEEQRTKALSALHSSCTKQQDFQLTASFSSDTTKNNYHAAFNRVRGYIEEGDCYQINLTHRHQARYHGESHLAFSHLKNKLNTPYSGYLEFIDHQVISLSPEQFISVDGNKIETKPIKGTIKRGASDEDDKGLISTLNKSKKDRAENLMIVDLLRNDLNKSCTPGSVKVPKIFEVETYPNVHHLVSTITGEKTEQTTSIDVFRQAFPGGSITGAPKIRAMEIIEQLEKTRRGVYCGSIFYAGYDGNMDSNICIRTLLCKDSKIYCWGGGGIVADSNCEDEYQESITKVKNLMDELEKMSGLK